MIPQPISYRGLVKVACRRPAPISTVNGLTHPIPVICWRWLDAPATISTVNGLTHPTCYLLKMAWCPAPISTVNDLTHPACYLLKVAWFPLYLLFMVWCPYLLSAEVGLMPHPYFYCKWSDTSYLLSAEGDLMPPLLYLLEVVWYTYL